MAKKYDLSGVGGSKELVITAAKGAAFLKGGFYQKGDGASFKKQADGIESLLVSLAAHGFNMGAPKMIAAINGALDACKNQAE